MRMGEEDRRKHDEYEQNRRQQLELQRSQHK
jgi:hypothetical protein